MKELTSRQLQAISTKHRISRAALELLAEVPFEQLKMSTVASRASVSVGTLYHYFTSKEELFSDGFKDFDEMIYEMRDSLCFNSHIEAIRSVVYAQTCGSLLRGINAMTGLLRVQLSTHSNLFFSHERYFSQYITKHAQLGIENGEFLFSYSATEISEIVLRTSRGSIFDCTVKNTLEKIGEIAMHDLDIVLAHYTPNHSCDFPPANPAWLDTYIKWFKLNKQSEI